MKYIIDFTTHQKEMEFNMLFKGETILINGRYGKHYYKIIDIIHPDTNEDSIVLVHHINSILHE